MEVALEAGECGAAQDGRGDGGLGNARVPTQPFPPPATRPPAACPLCPGNVRCQLQHRAGQSSQRGVRQQPLQQRGLGRGAAARRPWACARAAELPCCARARTRCDLPAAGRPDATRVADMAKEEERGGGGGRGREARGARQALALLRVDGRRGVGVWVCV